MGNLIFQVSPPIVLALVIFLVYLLANHKQATSGTPVGLGGWLLLLIVGLLFLGPLIAAGQVNAGLLDVEAHYPVLKTVQIWAAYKSATWCAFLAAAALSFYAGLGLATQRHMAVVRRAKIVLWVIGPVMGIVSGVGIPVMIFGNSEWNLELLGSFIGTVLIAAVWATYLSKSARVRATYGGGGVEVTGEVMG